MYKLFFILVCAFIINPIKSQSFSYSYDNAGNRIKRMVIVIPNQSGASIFDPQTQSLSKAAQTDKKVNDELSGSEITIYPNPTRGEIVIRISPITPEMEGILEVYSLDGKLILALSQFQEYNLVDLTNVVPGNYILKLSIANKEKSYMIVKK
jgi:hypothetical protein